MVSDLFFYQLVLVALVWLCVMLQWAWPSNPAAVCPTTPESPGPRPKRHHELTPFVGLTTRPHCDACVHASAPRPHAPAAPPPRIVMTRGRRRQIDTAHQFGPNPACAYRGWGGLGNLRANGHPNGGPWRQLLCVACHRPALTASTALAAALQVCGEHAAGRHAGGQPRRSAASRPRFPAARALPQRVSPAHQALRT